MAVFGWFVHYVLIMVILELLQLLGICRQKMGREKQSEKDTAASGNAGKE